LGDEELPVELAAFGIVEERRRDELYRHVALGEGVVAQVDLGGRARSEVALDRVLPDLLQGERLVQGRALQGARLRARALLTAALTCAGAVPPTWLRLATEPSSVSDLKTSAPMAKEKPFSALSGSAARSQPAASAARTARATASCASRNGTPLRTR